MSTTFCVKLAVGIVTKYIIKYKQNQKVNYINEVFGKDRKAEVTIMIKCNVGKYCLKKKQNGQIQWKKRRKDLKLNKNPSQEIGHQIRRDKDKRSGYLTEEDCNSQDAFKG